MPGTVCQSRWCSCSCSLSFVNSFPLTGPPWTFRPAMRGCGVTEGRSMQWEPGRQSVQHSSSLPSWGDKQVKGTSHYEWLLSKTKAWPLSSVTQGHPKTLGWVKGTCHERLLPYNSMCMILWKRQKGQKPGQWLPGVGMGGSKRHKGILRVVEIIYILIMKVVSWLKTLVKTQSYAPKKHMLLYVDYISITLT